MLLQSVDVVIDSCNFVLNFLFDSLPLCQDLFICGFDLVIKIVHLFFDILKHPEVLLITFIIDIELSLRLLELDVTALGQSVESFVISLELSVEPFVFGC